MLLMKFKDKVFLIKEDWGCIFNIKMGEVLRVKNNCYQTSKWIGILFTIYYYGGIFLGPIFIIWIYVAENISHNIDMLIIITLVIYFIIELLVMLLIPLKKINCSEVYQLFSVKR